MNLRPGFSFRIALLYFLIIGGVFWFILHKALDTLDASVRQAAEGVMVDSANFVAELLSQQAGDGKLNVETLEALIPAYLERRLDARIWSVTKKHPDMQVYVTDDKGIVLFDSTGRHVGEDFSQWRDVLLTLRGFYGARSSPVNASEKIPGPESRAMYVAAPIRHGGQIIGVVTLVKEIRFLDPFVIAGRYQILTYAAVVLVISLLFGGLMTWWLSRSVRKLVAYADQLGAGRKAEPPKLQERELMHLTRAMERMREEIEGKAYVENYIHTLAHEMKSPLTGIQGATELLNEDMPPHQRQRFLRNIQDSTQRMTRLVERLLALASVEKRQRLEQVEDVDFAAMLQRLIAERRSTLDDRALRIDVEAESGLQLSGEPLLLEQAVANLLDNAIDFSPEGGWIGVGATVKKGGHEIRVVDQGPGIPDFARPKLFERFFSLPRPGTRKRSTGLGLSFVKEVMELHQGSIDLDNGSDGGARAVLRWPDPPGAGDQTS